MFFSELGGIELSPGQREILVEERGAAMRRVVLVLAFALRAARARAT